MKRIVSLFICVLTIVLSLVSCKEENPNEFENIPEYSKENIRYQYNMDEYITLPKFDGKEIEVSRDYIKYQINNTILSVATNEKTGGEYTAKRGDDLYVTFEFYTVKFKDPETQMQPELGDKIEEISESFLLEDLCAGNYCIPFEEKLIGLKIGQQPTSRVDVPKGFKHTEYIGKNLYMKYCINSKMTKTGDIVDATYTGYYIDENDKIVVENGKEKTFDSGNLTVFLGSKMAIDDFETNLTGVKVGEEVEFFATFPEDYGVADLNGKKVLFKAKVTKMYKVEEYDIDFIKAYCGEQFTSVEEYEQYLIKTSAKQNLITFLMNSATIKNYPNLEYRVYEEQVKAIAIQYEQKYTGTYDEYLQKFYGMNRDQYIKSNMNYEMVMYSVAYTAKIKPGEQAIKDAKTELIEYYKNYFMSVQPTLLVEEAEAEATSYVEELGYGSIYEQALYKMVEEYLETKYTIKVLP